MQNSFKHKIKNLFSVYLILEGLIFLSGCASYHAKPLDDFTETKTSHIEEEHVNQ